MSLRLNHLSLIIGSYFLHGYWLIQNRIKYTKLEIVSLYYKTIQITMESNIVPCYKMLPN